MYVFNNFFTFFYSIFHWIFLIFGVYFIDALSLHPTLGGVASGRLGLQTAQEACFPNNSILNRGLFGSEASEGGGQAVLAGWMVQAGKRGALDNTEYRIHLIES